MAALDFEQALLGEPSHHARDGSTKGMPSNTHADSDALKVMERFQQVMAQFLDTQRAVMLSLLNRSPRMVPEAEQQRPTEPLPATIPGTSYVAGQDVRDEGAATQRDPLTALGPDEAESDGRTNAFSTQEPVTTHSSIIPAPVVPQSSNDGSAGDMVAKLLSIVEARTGYPSEVLGLDLDLESELGMDSIKRVEIVGTLHRSVMPDSAIDSAFMEQVTRARTLRAIAEHFQKAMPPRSNLGHANPRDLDPEAD